MDGFTGLNLEGVASQIDSFIWAATRAGDAYNASCVNFIQDLKTRWASNGAIGFSRRFNVNMSNIENIIFKSISKCVSGANYAAIKLAAANQEDWIPKDFRTAAVCSPSDQRYGLCSETYNGITGMAVEKVQEAFETFSSNLKKVIANLEEIPRTIDFYSTDGSLVSQYSLGIQDMIAYISDAISDVETLLKGYISTETENILLAKDQAFSSMGGNN